MMRLLHTKLPEFFKMMKRAANWGNRPKDIEITGLEHLHSAKMQSMRSGVFNMLLVKSPKWTT